VHKIRSAGLPPDTPLSFLENNTHVVAADILNAVRMAARQTNLPTNGDNLTRIRAHSLRASGAMALKLNGYDKEIIMKIGRWSSDTFLTYIHSQIAALTMGVAAKMTRQVNFQNVGS
jgi:integrase